MKHIHNVAQKTKKTKNILYDINKNTIFIPRERN